MKTITQNQYYQLVGLITAAKRQYEIVDAMAKAAREITDERDHNGDPEDSGHTCDMLSGARELDDGLRIMGVTVEKAEDGSAGSETHGR